MPPARIDPSPTAADQSFRQLHDFFTSSVWFLFRNVSLFLVAVFWVSSAYWVYKDARRRVDDPWLLAIATALGVMPFVGPLVYMFFRPPEYLEDARERELDILAVEQSLRESRCPECRTRVEATFLSCPACTAKLRRACRGCSEPLEIGWLICPYCETRAAFEATGELIAKSPQAQARSAGPRADAVAEVVEQASDGPALSPTVNGRQPARRSLRTTPPTKAGEAEGVRSALRDAAPRTLSSRITRRGRPQG